MRVERKRPIFFKPASDQALVLVQPWPSLCCYGPAVRAMRWVQLGVAAVLLTLTIGAAWWQYRPFVDTRDQLQKLRIDYGAGYSDTGAEADAASDLALSFWQVDKRFYVSVKLTLNNERPENEARRTTCFFIVPPGAEPTGALALEKQPELTLISPGLKLALKSEDDWFYELPCMTSKPPTSDNSSTSVDYGALFTVSPNSYYQTRFDQWVLDFDPIGADGVAVISTTDASAERIVSGLRSTLGRITYKVDGFGMAINPHVPGSHRVTHQTDSMVDVTAGSGASAVDDQSSAGGTPSITFTSPNEQLLLGLVQTFSALLLGIVLDRLLSFDKGNRKPEPESQRKPEPKPQRDPKPQREPKPQRRPEPKPQRKPERRHQ